MWGVKAVFTHTHGSKSHLKELNLEADQDGSGRYRLRRYLLSSAQYSIGVLRVEYETMSVFQAGL